MCGQILVRLHNTKFRENFFCDSQVIITCGDRWTNRHAEANRCISQLFVVNMPKMAKFRSTQL